MEKFILNGEVYVKTAPSVHIKHKLNVYGFTVGNAQTSDVVEVTSSEDLKSLPPFVLQELEKYQLITKVVTPIWDNSGFFRIYTGGLKIYMISTDSKQIKVYDSLEEINKEYMSLDEFMKKALYVGRNYDSKTNKTELLYSFDRMHLLRFPSDEYYILDKENPILKDYSIGNILPMYYEKSSVQQAIIKQESKSRNDGEPKR